MANHGPAYGLSADIKDKMDSKLDPSLLQQAKDYIKDKTGVTINDFHEDLKDGVVLCDLANALRPGTVGKINKGKMPFVQMENINSFLTGCERLGLQKIELFMTVDLYEAKNLIIVVDTILALKKNFP